MNACAIYNLCLETKDKQNIKDVNTIHKQVWNDSLKITGRCVTCVLPKGSFALYKGTQKNTNVVTLAVTTNISSLIQDVLEELRLKHYPDVARPPHYGTPITFGTQATSGTAYLNAAIADDVKVEGQEPFCCCLKLIVWEKNGYQFKFVDLIPCYNEQQLQEAS